MVAPACSLAVVDDNIALVRRIEEIVRSTGQLTLSPERKVQIRQEAAVGRTALISNVFEVAIDGIEKQHQRIEGMQEKSGVDAHIHAIGCYYMDMDGRLCVQGGDHTTQVDLHFYDNLSDTPRIRAAVGAPVHHLLFMRWDDGLKRYQLPQGFSEEQVESARGVVIDTIKEMQKIFLEM